MLKEILEPVDGVTPRALVIGHADEERVVHLADSLTGQPLRAGDSLLIEPRSGYVYERIPKSEVEELVLEEVPDVDYSDIGGLSRQIEQIRDAVELPFLHADLFREHQLRPPKGILLYGPPGCGKTLIAKAVANSLAKKIAERQGRGENRRSPTSSTSRAPSCSTSTWARPSGTSGWSSSGRGRRPARARRSSCSSTRWTRSSAPVAPASPPTSRTTIVPQLLSEIDGVEGLENVIVIGASNREDMIDPAILRPGRLDVKIKIERPDAEAARDIFTKYLTTACRSTPTTWPSTAAAARRRRRDDPAHRRARCTPRPRRTGSSRSPTPTVTRKSCTSRTSTPAR